MKKKKFMAALLVCFLLTVISPTAVLADNKNQEIEPRLTYISDAEQICLWMEQQL